ncbi:MAG: hypothetical protein JW747_01935 [Candidatus Aminicenantes bacterium]|nr:hypothetical protein [Candidatus Aminicenantes bacterium]
MNVLARPPEARKSRPGFTLIIVILVIAFLLSVGMALLSVTGSGPKLAVNVRSQAQALNAAEAGFDMAWETLETAFTNGEYANFESQYLRDPTGIDLPQAENFFRRQTDLQMLALLDADQDGVADYPGVLFLKETFHPLGSIRNPLLTYTVFLIDDEAGGGALDNTDVLLVCIGTSGSGPSLTTSRLEVLIGVEGT